MITWLKENWQGPFLAVCLVGMGLAGMAVESHAIRQLAQPCPCEHVKRGAPTVTVTPDPLAKPVDFTPSYPMIGQNTGTFNLAAVGAGIAIESPAYLNPVWWNQTPEQRRLSVSMAYGLLYGGGGKLLGLDALEKLRLYQVAYKQDFGFVMTNPFNACAGGECWNCMAFRDGVMCERSDGSIAVDEFSSGPQIAAHVTVAPTLTLSAPPMPPGTPTK
jgi:hypothetical protein